MFVDLDADQYAMGEAVRQVGEAYGGLTALRQAWERDSTGPAAQWAAFGDLGLFAMLQPEPEGLGMGAVELVSVARALGMVGATGPLIGHISYLPLVAGSLTAQQRSALLSGELRLAVSTGHGPVVPHAREASLWAVHEQRGTSGPELRIYSADAVAAESLQSLDEARGAVRVVAGVPLARIALEPTASVQAVETASLALSAQLLGMAERLLAMTVEYVGVREQFGVPVGSFQAVQHRLADIRVGLDRAWPSVLVAAARVAEGADKALLDVSVARVLVDGAVDGAAYACLQSHGAMGYSREHPLHMICSTIWAARGDFGDRDHHLSRIDALLADGSGPE